jgi:PAS domain S-box-containing protein
MTDSTLFTAYGADRTLAALSADPRPAFVWSIDGRELHWSNRAGAALLGLALHDVVRDGATLAAASLAPQIAAVGRGLAKVDAMRIERLRFPGLARLEAVSCACRLINGPHGTRGVQVTALEVPRWLKQRQHEPLPRDDPPSPAPAKEESSMSRPIGVWTWVPNEPATPAPSPPPPPPPRTHPLRFVFQTDQEGRLTTVSKELAAALGSDKGNWSGKTFGEIAAVAGADPDGPIGRALASRDTWTGLVFEWRDEAAREVIPIEMSALPVFDRNRAFQGFRGFGICRPPVPLEQADVREPSTTEPAGPTAEPSGSAEPPLDQAAQAPEPPEPTEATPSPPAATPVIDLGELREQRSPSDPKVVRLPARQAPPARLGLSASERSAFREIARVLGARLEGDREPGPAEAPPAPRSAPSSPNADAPGDPRSEAVNPHHPAHPEGALESDWNTDREADSAEPADPVGRLRGELHHEVARPAAADPDRPTIPLVLVDRLPVGVIVARGDRLLYVNRTLLDLLGYPDLAAVEAAGGLGHLFAGRGLVPTGSAGDQCESVLLTTADGTKEPVEGRVQTVEWEGEKALLIAVRRSRGADDGERLRQAQSAAAAAERRASELQAVLDTATDGVVILDGAGRIVGINRSAEALFGYEVGDIAGKGMLLLFAPESHRAAFDYLDSLKSNGVATLLNDGREVMGRVRQGGLVPLFMTIGRLGDAEDNRFCAVLRDLTSFKKAESELVAAKRQAEQASLQKSDFLAKVSHEVRTPLSAIIGFAEVMMEERFGPLGNDRYRAYVRDIHASGGHVVSLVNDLLDLSKIEAGKLDLTFTSVSLNDIVQQSVAIMQPQANRDRIIIRTALAETLPNVVADDRSIRQIALNLLSNSIKFTTAGGQVIVSTTLSEQGEAILRVRDTGVGMTEAELAVAMEPFRQVSTSSLGGTGLGLPLTKALVEANRATFAIQSAKNAGTIVEVIFPATRVLAE